MLRAHTIAFVKSDAENCKKARHNLHRSSRQAKRHYRLKVEGYYTTAVRFEAHNTNQQSRILATEDALNIPLMGRGAHGSE